MLDPRIEAVRAQYGLSSSDFWQIPQNKQWVCKHAALEVVATKANVEWQAPQIIEADTSNGIAVLSVAGKLGERLEWATGEASPKNNKNSYPWAMAEKRAKDRVVLKLVGIHGLVYSEDEMPNVNPPAPPPEDDTYEPPPRKANGKPEQGYREDGTRTSFALKKEQPNLMTELDRELDECKTLVSLEKLRKAWWEKATTEKWNATYKATVRDRIEGREKAIMEEMDRLAEAPDEELSRIPAREAFEHSLHSSGDFDRAPFNPLGAG